MNKIIEALQWRYATKEFDVNRKLTANQVDMLKESINLTATSMGLQPFKVVVVSNDRTQESLLPVSYNQPQITSASHLFIFCAIDNIDENYVDDYVEMMAIKRNQSIESLTSYTQMVKGFVDNFDDDFKMVWASKQAYIAIGNLLTVCALEKIDSCPMEGFDQQKYGEILGLSELGLRPLALVAVGFRSDNDKYASILKVRKSTEDLFIDK